MGPKGPETRLQKYRRHRRHHHHQEHQHQQKAEDEEMWGNLICDPRAACAQLRMVRYIIAAVAVER
jgi:hypothetical protein